MVNLRPTYQADVSLTPYPAFGSRLVYGTSGLGGVWGPVSEDESIQCILYALENGITSFDTSPSYSNAECYLGKALSAWKGPRPFISTKVGRLKTKSAFEAKLDYRPVALRDSLMRSLDDLKLDQVDLLFLHEPQWVPLEQMGPILETLLQFREEGLTTWLGVGGNPSPGFMPYLKSCYFQVISSFTKLDACNLSAFQEILPVTKSENIVFYAASSLHFSLLGNRFAEYTRTREAREGITVRDIESSIAVDRLAKEVGMPLAQLAQRYLFSVAEADRIVIGARTISQIKSTLHDWSQGALPQPLFDRVTTLVQHHQRTL